MKIFDSIGILRINPGMRRESRVGNALIPVENPPPQTDKSSPWRSPSVLGSLLVLAFWFHGDAILGFILHLLHIVIEILEMGLEHLLEYLFHLEGRDAQFWTAWTGLGAFIGLFYLIFRQTHRRLSARFRSWGDFARWTRDIAVTHWPCWTPPLILLIVSASFF
ncbi:MAG: hypothetical protein ACKN9W_14985 [Methylococcus sp.]